MKKLHSSNRLVDISEPILAEDSTSSVIALSLSTILEQLDKDATHHDYLVALLLVFLAESGFRIAFVSNTSEWNQNTRLVCIPTNWKSQETGVYEIRLILHNIENFPLKLIVLPYGDKLLLNMIPYVEGKTVYSMIIQTLNYVNPYTNNLCFRYMNLKKISHSFKDELVTPSRTDILLAAGLMGPSLQCLPVELHIKIANILSAPNLRCLLLCSKKFYESCLNVLLSKKEY